MNLVRSRREYCLCLISRFCAAGNFSDDLYGHGGPLPNHGYNRPFGQIIHQILQYYAGYLNRIIRRRLEAFVYIAFYGLQARLHAPFRVEEYNAFPLVRRLAPSSWPRRALSATLILLMISPMRPLCTPSGLMRTRVRSCFWWPFGKFFMRMIISFRQYFRISFGDENRMFEMRRGFAVSRAESITVGIDLDFSAT